MDVLAIFSTFLSLKHCFSVLQHFKSFDDTCNIEHVLDTEDLHLVPQEIAERWKIYFSCYRRLKLAYFSWFRGRDELLRKFVSLTIFYSFFTVQKSTSNIYYSKGIQVRDIIFAAKFKTSIQLHSHKTVLENNH